MIFAELLETPRSYGDARIRIARASAPTQAGDLWVRFMPGSAGDYQPHGKGDRVLVGFAYNDPELAYCLASFSGNPEVQSEGNREIHARGGSGLRFVARGGESEILLDGGGNITITAADGDISIASNLELMLEGELGVIISSDGDVDVEQSGALATEAVALKKRTGEELLALYVATKAAMVTLSATFIGIDVAFDLAITTALTGSGGPTVIVGSQAAINLNAEPDPL